MDMIQKRYNEGKCPICKCEDKPSNDKREVTYKGETISICQCHPYLEPSLAVINKEITKVRANKYKHKRKK